MLPMRLTKSLFGDIGLAFALAAFGVVGTAGADDNTEADLPIDARGFALVLACAAVLVLRRRWPLITLGTATILTWSYLILGYTYGPILVTFAVAVYTVARYLPLARSVPASVAALAILLTALFTNSAALPGYFGLIIPATAWVIVPFAIGFTVRLTRETADRVRAEAIRQRVDDERLRVAQEVHDVVGHGLAAIKMQADVALHVLHKKPEQAEIALNAISRTSTDALDELRVTLAAVRHTEPDAARSPTPGLARLEALGQRMSEAGVDVLLESHGPAKTLSAAVDLAGYRIVQESLTNVLRHSDATVATVRLGYEADALVITVSNAAGRARIAGAGSTVDHGDRRVRPDGFGISGMRDRVALLGGDFAAGPTQDGRFEVRACLPTTTAPA